MDNHRISLSCPVAISWNACIQEIVAVNLANQHGSEGVLSAAFKEEAERYAGKAGGMKLVAFDFHKQCGATRYDRCPQKPPLYDKANFRDVALCQLQQS